MKTRVNRTLRLMIVEQDPLTRAMYVHLFCSHPRIECTGLHDTLHGAIGALSEAAPDIVLLGWHFSDGMGDELIREIQRTHPRTITLVTTGDPLALTLRTADTPHAIFRKPGDLLALAATIYDLLPKDSE